MFPHQKWSAPKIHNIMFLIYTSSKKGDASIVGKSMKFNSSQPSCWHLPPVHASNLPDPSPQNPPDPNLRSAFDVPSDGNCLYANDYKDYKCITHVSISTELL